MNRDHELFESKAASWTLENTNDNVHIITFKSNSTFGTIMVKPRAHDIYMTVNLVSKKLELSL